MAITLDALLGDAKTHATGPLTFTTTNPVAVGGMIVLIAARFDATTTHTMSVTTTGGLSWSSAGIIPQSSGSLRIQAFYAFAPSGLSSGTTLVVTNQVTTTDMMGTALSLLGVDTANPVSGSNGSGSTGTAWTGGSIAANNGDAMFGASFEDGDGTDTSLPTSPAVEYSDFNDATQTEAFTAAYKLSVAGTDSVAGAWANSVTHIDIGFSFKALGAQSAYLPRGMGIGV